MQWIVKLVAAIVPYLLRFLDKHSDEYLEALNKRITKFLGGDNSATIKLNIINELGKPVYNVLVMFNTKEYGEICKKSDKNIVVITGLKEGKHEFLVEANNKEELVSIEIEDCNIYLDRTIVVRG